MGRNKPKKRSVKEDFSYVNDVQLEQEIEFALSRKKKKQFSPKFHKNNNSK
jgi:hypothetical protein